MSDLSPAALVAQLDRYIVNQQDAKRAVALALRNRDRRQRIAAGVGSLAQTPHVLLVGPSGVGKTTLVRRAAEITGAPLVRADVAWLQEREGVGRGPAHLIADLIDIALRDRSEPAGLPSDASEQTNPHLRHEPRRRSAQRPERAEDGDGVRLSSPPRPRSSAAARRLARDRSEAAIERVERQGLVLLDDIDRLASRDAGEHHEASGEALQRALIPLLDGADIVTEYGPVRTTHLLVIATGAFTAARVTDLVPEFVGRFPVRAELRSLDIDDFERILTAPERSLSDYYVQLLASDDIAIVFTQDGLREIAVVAAEANERGSDLGARRLVHVIEHVLEAVSFGEAPQATVCAIDAAYVRERCADLVEDDDFEQFIL